MLVYIGNSSEPIVVSAFHYNTSGVFLKVKLRVVSDNLNVLYRPFKFGMWVTIGQASLPIVLWHWSSAVRLMVAFCNQIWVFRQKIKTFFL